MSAHREKAILLLFELDRPLEADKVIREWLANDPNDAMLHCLLSHSFLKQHRIRAALASARRARELNPDYAYSHSTLGWALLSSGGLREAGRAFEEAVRCEPLNANYYYEWAHALHCNGRLNKAVEIAKRGLELDPLNIGCKKTIANCLVLCHC